MINTRFVAVPEEVCSAEFLGSLPSVTDIPQIYVHIGLPKTATTTLQTQVLMGHPGWVYLGTQLPRVLNADRDFIRFASFVHRGEGCANEVASSLMARHRLEGKPLMISEENLCVGAFDRYPQGHPLAQTRAAKLDRLCQVLKDMDALILVSLRPFRQAVFSAYVEYQEHWGEDVSDRSNLVANSDVMGMYRYAELRNDLELMWPERVFALDFSDIVGGELSWPGFSWRSNAPLPNTRKHPRADGGVLRKIVRKRPLMPAAKWLAPQMPGLAKALWSFEFGHNVVVPFWTDEVWSELHGLEKESEQARKAWLGLKDPR